MTAALPQPNEGSDWSLETLRQHLLALIAEMDRRYEQRFAAIADSTGITLAAMNRATDATLAAVNPAELRDRVVSAEVSLRAMAELTEAKFITYRALVDSQSEKVVLALGAADKAVAKAERATDERFRGVNEFRAQLADQTATFIPRMEAEQRIRQNAEKITALDVAVQRLTARIDTGEGRTGGHGDSMRNLMTVAGIGVAVVSVIAVIVGIYLANR